MKHFDFDVVVIGGGHAGCEAAHASARMGVRTGLITLRLDGIGVMSCNPAIGGLGKGHLVREIDALDGVMGRVADRAGIQFRLLNRRKGPAVQGPRAQADRRIYRDTMLHEIQSQENLHVILGEAVDFRMENDRVSGVLLDDGSVIKAKNVVLTTGTFLRGVIHIGNRSLPGGRMGDKPSDRLAARIDKLELPLGRLKTGTPPRLDGQTIAWDKLDRQEGDADPVFFSFMSNGLSAAQISCGVTHTNARTHEIIRENLDKSAMYGGQIEGIGPRYCPSIEDKIVRFADKESHQIFLEPEGLDDNTVYPNGISTSLPEAVQIDYVQSIFGLEESKIVQPGYAIEYDYVDPRALDQQLRVKRVEGLFFAGQINGTTGYEEAAAQGLVAGLNAALDVREEDPINFSRTNSYIGVMIDDLTSRGVSEPYRMFTSRAEFRLSLRADNADQRLTQVGVDIGCVSNKRRMLFDSKMLQIEQGRRVLEEKAYTPTELRSNGINVNQDGTRRSLFQVLSFPDVEFGDLVEIEPRLASVPSEIQQQISRDALYANYIARQEKDVLSLKKDEELIFPEGFDFCSIDGLSSELKSKLVAANPSTLAQAGKVEGMTPAGLILLSARLKRTADHKKVRNL